MAENITINTTKDGDAMRFQSMEAPSKGDLAKPKFEGTVRKKRRRGKYKRKIMKPFVKVPWQDRMKNYKTKRNNRFRKVVLSETHAPFNNNQFLMEIHKPEPENNFNIRTPSARTRDSSFSVDSEDNYFYSLPEDEEEYLTKEFSSVYEDAQTERLSNMSKNELIQEYLLLEVKYESLVKRTERAKARPIDEDVESDKETSVTDRDSMITERDTSETSVESSIVEDPRYVELLQRMKEQEEQLHELQLTNEKLRLENEHLHQNGRASSSSEDSESDSSSTSDSESSSSATTEDQPVEDICDNGVNGEINVNNHVNGQIDMNDDIAPPLVNGFHSPNE